MPMVAATPESRELARYERYLKRVLATRAHGFYARIAHCAVFNRKRMMRCFGRDSRLFAHATDSYDICLAALKDSAPDELLGNCKIRR